MKKALILTNLLWLSIFLFMGFKPALKPMASCDDITSNFKTEQFDGLNLKVASEMAALYKKNHLPKLISGRDSRTIWFSLPTLKKFIWEIEHYNCLKAQNNIPADDLGIRIYYGEYPNATRLKEDKIWNGVNPDYQALHTAFMIPTFWDGKVNHDYDPIFDYKTGKSTGKWTPTALSRIISNSSGNLGNLIITGLSMPSKKLDAQNHGGLCPPFCNDQDLAF